MAITYLRTLDIQKVYKHYIERERTHRQMRELFDRREVAQYVPLALGIDWDGLGNYSARQYNLGPRIRAHETDDSIFDCATALDQCPSASDLPRTVEGQGMHGIGLSVGSEMAMMLHPDRFWVGNRRTYWVQVLVQHDDSNRANEALRLFRGGEYGEMDNSLWKELYLPLGGSLRQLITMVDENGLDEGIPERRATYLWADAVADELYNEFAAS